MKRIALQFAGLLIASGSVACFAEWNAPTFGNTYRVAAMDAPMLPPAVPTPAMETSAPMAMEAGMPTPAGPVSYESYGGYAYGGGGACCEPSNPCSDNLWDGYWGAKTPWCMRKHGCGHGGACGCDPCGSGCGHHSWLPQINWIGGCCSHRACWNNGFVGHGHGAACGCDTCGGGHGHGLIGGHGHGGFGYDAGYDAGYAAPAPGCNCNH